MWPTPYRNVKLFQIGMFLLCAVNFGSGCSNDNHAFAREGQTETTAYDKSITSYVDTLPKLRSAISSVDASRLIGESQSLKGLSQDRDGALESLGNVEQDSRDVLSSHKLYDELQLNHDTVLLDHVLGMLNSDIAELVDQHPVNRATGLRWLSGLSASDGTTTVFSMDSYSFLLKRAKAIDHVSDPTLKH